PGMAISASKRGLLPITQNAMRFYDRLSYHDFEGFATEIEEATTLVRDLGPRNKAMILRNHGLLTCGATASEAVATMLALVLCCETQLALEASGAEILMPSTEMCEHAARQAEELRPHSNRQDHEAFVRILDRLDPSYRT
ncbi:MAG: class II aldolase/adducin family protein, partial [Lautropia sp.]